MKILIIDENKLYLEKITRLLKNICNDIITAKNKYKALELIRENNFDLILIDTIISEIDYVSLYKEIKKIAPETKVIVTTNDNNLNKKKTAIINGIYAYYSKQSTSMLINDIELIKNGIDFRNY